MDSVIRNSDFRVRIPPAIIIYSQKCWGVKFYGASITGVRTGEAVGLRAGVGDDTNGAVVNDFDSQSVWGQIRDISETAIDSAGKSYTDTTTGKAIINRFGYIPRFWICFTIGTDDKGAFVWYQIANYPKEGFWPAFTKIDGTPARFALVGKYNATFLGGGHDDVIGCVKGNSPVVSMSTASANSKMSYIQDKGLGITSPVRLVCGRTWQIHNAIDFLMKVEFATMNIQSVLPGVIYESWYSVKDYEAHNVWGTATNYISLPTTHYMVSGSKVGTNVCIYINGNTWMLRKIVDMVADTDSNGASTGYTRLTISGDAFTLPSGNNVYFFHTCANPAGITDVIKASSGNVTELTDGNTNGAGHHQFKYRAFEKWYGSMWEYVSDMAMKDVHDGVSNKITLVRFRKGSTLDSPSTYYEDDGISLPATSGWQKKQAVDGGCLVPTELGASDFTYVCDYYWINPRTTAGTSFFQVLVSVHGDASSAAGPRTLNLNDGFGVSDFNIAFRPCLLL